MAKYVFDKTSFSFKRTGRSFGSVLLSVLKVLAVTLALAVVNYILFSSVISTDTERRLRRENKMYEKIYPQMVEREELVGDVISGLQLKDHDIYRDIFNSEAPSLNSEDALAFIVSNDTIPDDYLVRYTESKAKDLEGRARRIENILSHIATTDVSSLPPMTSPLKDISYAQVGASTGQKLNPFYKIQSQHNGLDLIAPQGDPVFAAADGIVESVTLSRKGLGNVVEIRHDGNYLTRYCHLEDIEVRKGQVVKRGRELGHVGLSGNSFAPHLHYEVLLDGKNLDPVQFFFASVTPQEYMKMLFMSSNTGQSLD